jgi:hypothetical protein
MDELIHKILKYRETFQMSLETSLGNLFGNWPYQLTCCFVFIFIVWGSQDIKNYFWGSSWTGLWVGPRDGLDSLETRKNSFSCRDSNPGSCSPWASHRSDCGSPAHSNELKLYEIMSIQNKRILLDFVAATHGCKPNGVLTTNFL